MHKLLLFCVFLSLAMVTHAQQNDFLSFKKNGRTIKNYYAGIYITFYLSDGSPVSGVISSVKNDSLYLTYYDVRMIPNEWGTRSPDTIARYISRFHYKEIAAIPNPPKGFEFVRNGALLKIGAAGYAGLHTINGLIQKQKIYPGTLAICGGAYLAGIGMRKLRKYSYPIGKKYTMAYINMRST